MHSRLLCACACACGARRVGVCVRTLLCVDACRGGARVCVRSARRGDGGGKSGGPFALLVHGMCTACAPHAHRMCTLCTACALRVCTACARHVWVSQEARVSQEADAEPSRNAGVAYTPRGLARQVPHGGGSAHVRSRLQCACVRVGRRVGVCVRTSLCVDACVGARGRGGGRACVRKWECVYELSAGSAAV